MTATLSRYFPISIRAAIGSFGLAVCAFGGDGDFVSVRDTSSYPCIDPAGLTYYTPNGTLLLVDSEIDETGFFQNANMWELDLAGNVLRSFDLTPFTDEPTGIAYNESTGTIFITDDDDWRMYEVEIVGSNVNLLASNDLAPFGVIDAEGIDAHGVTGNLWIVVGNFATLNEFTPQGQLVQSIILPGAISDPESIVYNPTADTFFIGSGPGRTIFEVSTSGVVLDTIDIEPVETAHGFLLFKGLVIAPSSEVLDQPTNMSFYLADYGHDASDDGELYELTFEQAPFLTPVPPQQVETGSQITVPVMAIDPDGDPVSITPNGFPSFASLQDMGNGLAELTLTPTLPDLGMHTITVEATGVGCEVLTSSLDIEVEVIDGMIIGTNYCTALPNSSGQVGLITARGSAVVADNDVELEASGLPLNQFGYFLASPAQDFVMFPGGSSGNLCLGGGSQLGRYADDVQNSGAVGFFTLQIDLTSVPIAAAPFSVAMQAGDSWNFQAWYRDGSTSNFTDGVEIGFL